MFKVGELVKRKTVSNKPKSYCVIVDIDENNYTMYNNSLKCLQQVACLVVNELYDNVNNSIEKEVVYELT
jgi:hypothetical protein